MDISVKLDVNKAGQFINEPVTMRAGETDNVIKASIYKDNKPYTDFETATFNTTKLSGAVIANDPATVSGNVISYSVAPIVTNNAGKLRNSYFLLDGKTSTESFEVAILPGVSVGSDISAYIPGLQEFQDEWKKVNSGLTDKLDGIDKSVDTFLAKVQAEIEDKNSKFTDEQKAQITGAINDLKNQVATSKSDVNAMDNKLAAIKDSVKDFDVPQITADTKEALENAKKANDKIEDKVSVADTDDWQKQAIFKSGSFKLSTCPTGTDFETFLKSDDVPKGVSVIKDDNVHMDWFVLKESPDWTWGTAAKSSLTGVNYFQINNGTYTGNQSTMNDIQKSIQPVAATAYSAMVQDADTSAVKAQNAQIAYSLMTGDE